MTPPFVPLALSNIGALGSSFETCGQSLRWWSWSRLGNRTTDSIDFEDKWVRRRLLEPLVMFTFNEYSSKREIDLGEPDSLLHTETVSILQPTKQIWRMNWVAVQSCYQYSSKSPFVTPIELVSVFSIRILYHEFCIDYPRFLLSGVDMNQGVLHGVLHESIHTFAG